MVKTEWVARIYRICAGLKLYLKYGGYSLFDDDEKFCGDVKAFFYITKCFAL